MFRIKPLTGIFFLGIFTTGAFASLVQNGDFSNGLSAWDNISYNFGGSWAGSSSFSVVDEAPFTDSFKMEAIAGGNYSLQFVQEIPLTESFSSFSFSADWKVTVKENPWGVNRVELEFLDSGTVVGRAVAFDTSRTDYDLDYFRGGLPLDSFVGLRYYRSTFNWETFSIDTLTDMPGLDALAVDSLRAHFQVQNDAGSGGIMIVDNIVANGTPVPIPATSLLFLGGLAPLALRIRRRRA